MLRISRIFVREDWFLEHLSKAIFGTIGIKIAYTFLNFSISIFLARLLTPDGYGVYAFTFSIMLILAVPVQAGLPELLIREVARYHVERRWALLKGVLLRANQLVFLFAIGVGVIAFSVVLLFSKHWGQIQTETLIWALVLLPLVALNRLREAAIQGLGKVVLGQVPEYLLLPSVFLTLLLIAQTMGGLTPPVAMALYCATAVLALVVGMVLLIRVAPETIRTTNANYDTGTWVRSLLPFSLLAGLAVFQGQADILMLGMLAQKDDVGLYRVALSGAALVVFVSTAVNAVLAPRIPRLFIAGELSTLQRLVTKSTRASIIAAIPVAITLMFFGKNIINLVYGDAYQDAHFSMIILCIAQLVNVFVGPVHILLNMTGNEQETVKGSIFAVCLNIFLSVILIPLFGIIGAAISTAASIASVNFILFWLLWRRTGISGLPVLFSVRNN